MEDRGQLNPKTLSTHRPAALAALHVAVGVLLGCVLTLVLMHLGQTRARQRPVSKAAILAAMPVPVRLTEGRIFGQSTYAPYPTRPRWTGDRKWAQLQRELMERSVQGSPDWLRNRAHSYLLAGRLDSAIAALEEAVVSMPANPALLSDLSALYGEQAQAAGNPENFVAALEMADRAVAAAPDLPEPVFNRAVALERLFLQEEARRTWARYLALDADSPWLMTYLAPRWAEAIARGERKKAAQRLKGAGRIADVLAVQGNWTFQNVVQEMEKAAKAPNGPREALLIQSLRRLRAGRDLMEAERDLRSIQSAAVLMAYYYRVHNSLQQQDFKSVRAVLDLLAQEPLLSGCPSLEAWRQATLGLLAGRARPTEAVTAYRRALDLFTSLGEKHNAASVQVLLAFTQQSLGRPAEAWRYRYRSLAWAGTGNATSRQAYVAIDALGGAVLASLARGWPEAALDLQSQQVALAERYGEPEDKVNALLQRARIEAALGKEAAANNCPDMQALRSRPRGPGKAVSP